MTKNANQEAFSHQRWAVSFLVAGSTGRVEQGSHLLGGPQLFVDFGCLFGLGYMGWDAFVLEHLVCLRRYAEAFVEAFGEDDDCGATL